MPGCHVHSLHLPVRQSQQMLCSSSSLHRFVVQLLPIHTAGYYCTMRHRSLGTEVQCMRRRWWAATTKWLRSGSGMNIPGSGSPGFLQGRSNCCTGHIQAPSRCASCPQIRLGGANCWRLSASIRRAVADARPSRAAFVVLGQDLVLQSARNHLE